MSKPNVHDMIAKIRQMRQELAEKQDKRVTDMLEAIGAKAARESEDANKIIEAKDGEIIRIEWVKSPCTYNISDPFMRAFFAPSEPEADEPTIVE